MTDYSMALDPQKIPRHVAIIMDGNGRWAQRRGWFRVRGHVAGMESVRVVTRLARRLATTPDWQPMELHSSLDVRRFIDTVQKRLRDWERED